MSRLTRLFTPIGTIIALLGLSVGAWANDFDKGSELFLYNIPAEAVPYLEKALYEDPKNPSVYACLSMAYIQLAQYDRAISLLNSALDKGVGDKVAILGEIAKTYARKGSSADALKYYSLSLETKPDDSWTLLQRGNTFIRTGELLSALTDYERFLVVDPKNDLSPDVARMIAAIKEELRTRELAKKAEEDMKAADAARQKAAEEQKQLAEEQRRKDEEARKKLMDDIYASLNASSNEQTDLSVGTDDVKKKPTESVLEE